MTDNNSKSEHGLAFFEPSPFKLVLITASVMLVGIICSSAFIYAFTQSQAKSYISHQVDIIKNQAKVTLQPMILTRDTLNMNFYLRSLTEANFINGISLSNDQQKQLAKAGQYKGDKQTVALFSQQLAIGELSLYINTVPATQYFNKLLWIFMVLATITGLFTLLAVGYYSKKILKDFSNQYKPLLEHRFSMELANLSEVDPEEKTEIDQVLPQQLHTQDSSPVSLAIVDLEKPHKTETLTGDSLENQKLVSLLKPDSQQRMPHFKPYSNPTDDSVKQPVQTTLSEIELTESIPDNTEKSFPTFSENPLLRPHLHEQQLDLYSLEHQTELSLKAADAAYLLFIDCSSNRAPIENPEEHNHLLTQYRRLINLVINIYGGNLELLASGDIRVMFDDQDINDNHGVQALCAAKLFNQLYKYYNHRQITRMQPTLNIQLSLVRGNRAKIELLREEAHFLTCTTVSNELISHTPLSEVQALKETLLDNAQTERQDEDKILILSLNASYQELLERQARHLAKTI